MTGPYSITITVDDPAWGKSDTDFEQALRYELACAREAFRLERRRRQEAFWQDLGRPADGHIGAVGGE